MLIIVVFTIGLLKLRSHVVIGNKNELSISIIIAARNEELNIGKCLHDILLQEYDRNHYEVIVVNDCSTDSTERVIRNIIKENPSHNIKLISLNSQLAASKKEALKKGIEKAEGKIIVTTDADCRMGINWLKSIGSYYEETGAKMILGPVYIENDNKIFKKMQTLEFMGLMGVAAGSASIGMPVMCNGANLAFERQAFRECGGYENNSNYSSGDDMFLMINIANKYPKGIRFLKSKDSIVITGATESISEFITQRIRWTSKTKGYLKTEIGEKKNFKHIINPGVEIAINKDKQSKGLKITALNFKILIVAIIVYLTNFSLLGLLITSIYIHESLLIFIFLFILKNITDIVITALMAVFMKKTKLLWYFPFVQFINIFYVSLIGVLGIFMKTEWKGREILK